MRVGAMFFFFNLSLKPKKCARHIDILKKYLVNGRWMEGGTDMDG
jgi:hypothetical protein